MACYTPPSPHPPFSLTLCGRDSYWSPDFVQWSVYGFNHNCHGQRAIHDSRRRLSARRPNLKQFWCLKAIKIRDRCLGMIVPTITEPQWYDRTSSSTPPPHSPAPRTPSPPTRPRINRGTQKQILPRIFCYLTTAKNFSITVLFTYNFRNLSHKFPTICWSLICHISLPK